MVEQNSKILEVISRWLASHLVVVGGGGKAGNNPACYQKQNKLWLCRPLWSECRPNLFTSHKSVVQSEHLVLTGIQVEALNLKTKSYHCKEKLEQNIMSLVRVST